MKLVSSRNNSKPNTINYAINNSTSKANKNIKNNKKYKHKHKHKYIGVD